MWRVNFSPDMPAYLDNDIVCGLVDLNFSEYENEALKVIHDHLDSKTWDLVTSELSAREIARYLGPKKAGRASKKDLEAMCAQVRKVPFVEDHTVRGFHNEMQPWYSGSYPLVSDDPISSELRKLGLGPDRTDRHHLMIAIRGGCKVFLTFDHRILHARTEILRRFKIEPMKPSEFVRARVPTTT
jgi:hypothetical protein